MGKSNNPAKRATQDAERNAKKSRSSRGSGFLKFILVLVLSLAILGPFLGGVVPTGPTAPRPATPVTTAPAQSITQSSVPVPAVTAPAAHATAPAGQ